MNLWFVGMWCLLSFIAGLVWSGITFVAEEKRLKLRIAALNKALAKQITKNIVTEVNETESLTCPDCGEIFDTYDKLVPGKYCICLSCGLLMISHTDIETRKIVMRHPSKNEYERAMQIPALKAELERK